MLLLCKSKKWRKNKIHFAIKKTHYYSKPMTYWSEIVEYNLPHLIIHRSFVQSAKVASLWHILWASYFVTTIQRAPHLQSDIIQTKITVPAGETTNRLRTGEHSHERKMWPTTGDLLFSWWWWKSKLTTRCFSTSIILKYRQRPKERW